MIVNNLPTKVEGFTCSEITIGKSDGAKKLTSIAIVHNIPMIGNVNSIQAAFTNWFYRTEDHSAKGLVQYINSKNVFEAYTLEDFRKKFNVD